MAADPTQRALTSVIIPTYNRADLVGAAIDSALDQTRVPDEIIVVDDGSTDDTSRVLAAYGAPVRVIHQANRGRSAARNTGLRAAQGDFVVFLDSDDTLTPDSIESRARFLESHPDIDVVYGDMVMINAAGEQLGVHSEYMPGARPSGFILSELVLRCFILMPAMIRRTALGDLTFDTSLAQSEDYDLWRRLAARSRFQYAAEPVANYRIHDANTITADQTRQWETEVEVQSRFFAMPEFQQLSRADRARAYRSQGAKRIALGETRAARAAFARAVAAAPTSLAGCAMLVASIVVPGMLRRAILKRRSAQGRPLASVADTTSPAAEQTHIARTPVATH